MLRMRFWPCRGHAVRPGAQGRRAGAYHDGQADETDITTVDELDGEKPSNCAEKDYTYVAIVLRMKLRRERMVDVMERGRERRKTG